MKAYKKNQFLILMQLVPLGRQKEIKPLRAIVRAFLLWGKSAPLPAPQIGENCF